MRTLRLALAGTVTLALLGGLGNAVMAQSDESEPDDATVLVSVTGTSNWDDDCTVTERGETLDERPDASPERDQHMDCEVRASDPRVSGTWSRVANDFWYDDIGEGMRWGTATLDGADGGWGCTFTDIGDPYPESPVDDLYLHMCSGTGGFEGLTYVWHWGVNGPEGFWDDITVVGFIFPDMPTGWGPPPPTTE